MYYLTWSIISCKVRQRTDLSLGNIYMQRRVQITLRTCPHLDFHIWGHDVWNV